MTWLSETHLDHLPVLRWAVPSQGRSLIIHRFSLSCHPQVGFPSNFGSPDITEKLYSPVLDVFRLDLEGVYISWKGLLLSWVLWSLDLSKVWAKVCVTTPSAFSLRYVSAAIANSRHVLPPGNTDNFPIIKSSFLFVEQFSTQLISLLSHFTRSSKEKLCHTFNTLLKNLLN